ncbi:MAG TPA: lactate utilization protein B, partial [Longimicrobiales bacterium]|nr:lactate utilization protein B [Longimicrobiales bacterium]
MTDFGDTFPARAAVGLRNAQLRANLRKATTTIRAKRAERVSETPDWAELRAAAGALRERAVRELGRRLPELEASVERAGGHVHWARDAAEANRIITALVQARGVDSVVKVKSNTTDEIGLNDALAAAGIRAIETDLAELIIQLAGESSSHILVPAIHKNRTEIRDLFRRTIGPPDLSDEPAELADAARVHLRKAFLSARVGISGANFAVAETGTVGVVESEGNGRMCTTLPDVLITVMGIEKVVAEWRDLGVLLQLLPRSATGERMNPYNSLWTGVSPGDGPSAFHLVLLDNGRTRVLADDVGRQALRCIRCSACLNACPVYERVGGHTYGSVYQGPIGAILGPQLLGPGQADSLPFASTLCAACRDVCPVDIDIPRVLVHLRGRAIRNARHHAPLRKRWSFEVLAMRLLAHTLATPRRYQRAQRLLRFLQWPFARDGSIRTLPGWPGRWTAGRDLPAAPAESFRARLAADRPPPTADRRAFAAGEAAPQPETRRPQPASPAKSEPHAEPAAHARAAILTRIAAALAGTGPVHVPHDYRTDAGATTDALTDRFVERLGDYRARVRRIPAATLAAAIRDACRTRGVRSLAVPADLPEEWVRPLEEDGVRVLRDGEPGPTHLDEGPAPGDRAGGAADAGRAAGASRDAGESSSSGRLSVETLDAVDGVLTACAL